MTTNPTLFAASLADAREYANDLADLATRHVTAGEAARVLAAADVRRVCDVLLPTHQQTSGVDGWVSLEVDPSFANDADATLAEVRALRWLVDRPNVMIKVPATSAGVAAIAAATAEGHSINATLIFSVERYREVLGAYTAGLERARAEGLNLTGIHSVASLFVSRSRRGTGRITGRVARPTGPGRRGGNASILVRADPQRPLWASTGVKDPELDPTSYAVGPAIQGR